MPGAVMFVLRRLPAIVVAVGILPRVVVSDAAEVVTSPVSAGKFAAGSAVSP